MNLTHLLNYNLSVEGEPRQTVDDLSLMSRLILLALCSARLISEPLLVIIEDFLHISITLFSLIVLSVVVSFIKCLEPKYGLIRPQDSLASDLAKAVPVFRNAQTRDHSTSSASRSLPEKIIFRIKKEHGNLEDACRLATSGKCVRSIHDHMLWLHTRRDLESVHWFNQALLTLWPSFKTLIHTAMVSGTSKPKRRWTMPETRELTRKRSKLSVLISSRRKLNSLQYSIDKNLQSSYDKFSGQHLIAAFFDAMKMIFIHLKQFIADFISTKFFQHERINSCEKRSVDIEEVLSRKLFKPRSWSGTTSDNRKQRKTANLLIRKCKFRSAPVELINRDGKGIVYSDIKQKDRFRRKRFMLAKILEELSTKKASQRQISIDRLRLGKSCPVISGIKLVDEPISDLDQVHNVLNSSVTTDEENLRFLGEIAFSGDKEFCVRLASLPLLDKIEIKSVRVKLRILVTINHTPAKSQDKLEILKSKASARFLQLNYVQVTLIDTPEFDWLIQTPTLTRASSDRVHTMAKSLSSRILSPQNLIRIMNHPYFKYLCHNVIHLFLRWFDSFDIKAGSKIYIRPIP